MLNIYLVRHGETVWNTEQRLQGHKDSSLTQRGRDQADVNGKILKALIGISDIRLVSSPLGRALNTSEIIARQLGLAPSRIETDDRLKELCYGRWEGMTKSEVQVNDSVLYEARKSDRWNVKAPGGESYRDVAERLKTWLVDFGDEKVVAVSHGCAGRILRGLHARLNPDQIIQLDEKHDSIFLLQTDGKITNVGRAGA